MFHSKHFQKAVNESLKQEKFLLSIIPNKQKSFERYFALNDDLQGKLSCNFLVWKQTSTRILQGRVYDKICNHKKGARPYAFICDPRSKVITRLFASSTHGLEDQLNDFLREKMSEYMDCDLKEKIKMEYLHDVIKGKEKLELDCDSKNGIKQLKMMNLNVLDDLSSVSMSRKRRAKFDLDFYKVKNFKH